VGARKKSRIPDHIEIAALKETVVVNENGDRKTITKFEAFVKPLALRWRHCQRLNDGPIALNHAREVLVAIAEARLSITTFRQVDNNNQAPTLPE
jgi:hypothetical protein